MLNKILTIAFALAAVGTATLHAESMMTAAGKPAEGSLAPFMGKPQSDIQQLFKGGRFPSVVTALDGTVLAFWAQKQPIKLRRSEDGGATWEPELTIGDTRSHLGAAIVDEKSGDVLVFQKRQVFHSSNSGKTWKKNEDAKIRPNKRGHRGSTHGADSGITLRHGKHKGRLLQPSRVIPTSNERRHWPEHYNNAIYSDDGGKTWQTSAPFPAFGTGEGTLAELSDGRVYYNSRRHWTSKGENPRRRWIAWSYDGGETWKDLSICEVLPDGAQHRNYGCKGGLVRLQVRGRDILIFSNIESPRGRHHGKVWASFDGGQTWPVKRLVYEGSFAYSSLAAGRPDTPSEGWIYLQFESGGGCQIARFNLSWLLKGEPTGDGELPEEFAE